MAVAVRGLQRAEPDVQARPQGRAPAIRDEYRTVAEPVRSTAETLAVSSDPPDRRRSGRRMRTGVTTTARVRRPRAARRQRPRRASARRPNLATLLDGPGDRARAGTERAPDRSRLRPDARPARATTGTRWPVSSSSRSSATHARSSVRSPAPAGAPSKFQAADHRRQPRHQPRVRRRSVSPSVPAGIALGIKKTRSTPPPA